MLRIIDAFDVPRFTYSIERKKYLSDKSLAKDGPKVYGGNSAKSQLRSVIKKTSRPREDQLCWA